MTRWGRLVAALALGLPLPACHAPVRGLSGERSGDAALAVCGSRASLGRALLIPLTQGRPAETSPAGICAANAARNGSTAAALLLADAYRQSMAPYLADTAPAVPARATNSPLGLDLFGRRIGWLRLAAAQGDARAQVQIAREIDAPPSAPMYYVSLAWYQAAAEHGDPLGGQAIAAAYSQGRITDERLYAFRKWLRDEAGNHPEARRLLQILAKRPRRFV